jgi:hypothetical protein
VTFLRNIWEDTMPSFIREIDKASLPTGGSLHFLFPTFCLRRAETEAERAPKLSGSKPVAMQQTHVRRLSTENKGGFPYIPCKAG